MIKYFVDSLGNYLGSFDGSLPPIGAIEAPIPPEDGRDKWNGVIWVKNPERVAKAAELAFIDSEKQTVKTLPRVQAFIAKSRADLKAEIQAANLAALKDVVEDLAIIVHILAKREFK